MRTLVIGSTAAQQYVPWFREPKDFDVFSDYVTGTPGEEVFWHPSFQGWIPEGRFQYATLDELYTIKVSHGAWDLGGGSWEKHMNDVVTFKNAGAKLDDLKLFKLLYKVWEEKHGRKVVNLNQDKEEFFSDAVRRVYDHDSIHASVAIGSRPMYERFLDGEVNMNMTDVWASPLRVQLDLFAEEIAATALERWVVPSDYKFSPRRAWAMATKKTITSLTKGRSSRFLIENYDEYRKPRYDYTGVHKSKLHLLEAL